MSCWGYIGNQWLSLLLLEVASSSGVAAREGGSLTVRLYSLTSQSRNRREEILTKSSAGTLQDVESFVFLAFEVNPSQWFVYSSHFADLLGKCMYNLHQTLGFPFFLHRRREGSRRCEALRELSLARQGLAVLAEFSFVCNSYHRKKYLRTVWLGKQHHCLLRKAGI